MNVHEENLKLSFEEAVLPMRIAWHAAVSPAHRTEVLAYLGALFPGREAEIDAVLAGRTYADNAIPAWLTDAHIGAASPIAQHFRLACETAAFTADYVEEVEVAVALDNILCDDELDQVMQAVKAMQAARKL